MADSNKLIIIDGNSLLFRAYYATAYRGVEYIMKTSKGVPTNAIYSLNTMLCKILKDFTGGERVLIAFDSDKETFRKEAFEDYKANRSPCPEELKPQFASSRELCAALGIFHFEKQGIEADDICGTVAKMGSAANLDVTIYTSDKDYLQLIDENIHVALTKKGLSNLEVYDEKKLMEEYGLTPSQVIDFKGLAGDNSDNYPGIPGIGKVTATKLLNKYGDFPTIVKEAPNMKNKVGEKILNNLELGEMSYKLARIMTDVEIPFKLDDLIYEGCDKLNVQNFAEKYEFTNMTISLPPQILNSKEDLKTLHPNLVESFENIKLTKNLGIVLDIDYEDYHDTELKHIVVADEDGNVYFETKENLLKDSSLKSILESNEYIKNTYDGKCLIYSLAKLGIKLSHVENDLLLGAYIRDSSISSNPDSIYGIFGINLPKKEPKEFSLFDDEEEGLNVELLSRMAYEALGCIDKMNKTLKTTDGYTVYRDIEMPLLHVLAKMELEGFPLDTTMLLEYGKEFEKKRDAIAEDIYKIAGHTFNLNSPMQIGKVLYEEMGLNGGKSIGTSADKLMTIEHESPIISQILEYRKYAKLISTYVDGFVPHVKSDGKIHSYFNQALTTTGRLSSSKPNLQNISARDIEGKQIRKCFYVEDGCKLLSLDYGQIELRILAALSGCQKYIDVFNTDRDVHTETAKHIFHTDEVTPLMRRKAKAVNFAIIYGSTPWGLAKQIEGTPYEATEIINNFYSTYPEIKDYLSKVTRDAEKKLYVTTITGRRRYMSDIKSGNSALSKAAGRAALNAPVQGSAADLIKIAMIKVDEFLSNSEYKTKMVLQIHDELIFKVPDEELEFMTEKLSNIMTNAMNNELDVKLTVEADSGKSWFEA